MKLPKMIIFDYGDTLLCEPQWDTERGNCELMKYATRNPNNCTAEDLMQAAKLIFGFAEDVRKVGCDISGQIGNKALYEYLGIEFSLSPLEQETVFWNACSAGALMPDADKVIDCLNALGIRTAVISNLLWSGEALKERLDRLLPNNKFEFVMTSSDYFMRKPNPVLFKIALQKAKLKSDEVWYCGNSFNEDIVGAKNANIFPVWYDTEHKKAPNADFEYMHINSWSEFIDILRGNKNEY